MITRTIHSCVFAGGSFGIGSSGELIRVWFCGAHVGPRHTHGNASGPCVHRSRAAARRCPAVDRPMAYDAPELSGLCDAPEGDR